MGVCIGVDVAKAHLDCAEGPQARVKRLPNTPAGVRRLVQRWTKLDVDRVILESTGQYERRLFEALADAGVSVVRVNPVRVRRFAEGMGVLAKNDALDARILALFGEKVEPAERPVKTPRERILRDLASRRRQLIGMVTAEKNRLEHAIGWSARDIRSLVRVLEGRVERLDGEINRLVAKRASMASWLTDSASTFSASFAPSTRRWRVLSEFAHVVADASNGCSGEI